MFASRTPGWLGFLALTVALVTLGGCGCTDDVGGIVLSPEAAPPVQAQVGVDAVGQPEDPVVPGPAKIDIMFLLDDSLFVTQRTPVAGASLALGEILTDLPPRRIKTDVAQEIFQDAVNRLKDRLVNVEGLGEADEFDLAFGVSRFEDYANFVRSGPKTRPDTETADPVDALARPFVLNLPILRQDESLFTALFSQALQQEAPGNGGENPYDAQSALEALYQLASGAGFDGNGDGDNTDSGAAGEIATMTLDPGQRTPEQRASGDVPAPVFEEIASGSGEPLYQVGDVQSSGNVGGAGWRPDSIRFIVVFSDITTVTALGDLGPKDTISNTPSPTGEGPRPAETIANVQAFSSTVLLDPPVTEAENEIQQAQGRYGYREGNTPGASVPPVAPANAVTLQMVIDELNAKNIEVLGIGIREAIGSGPNKPNVARDDTELFPTEELRVMDPEEAPRNKAPFTWMSAVAILTGARDPNLENEVQDPRWEEGVPLVYNLVTLSPSQGVYEDDLIADLSDRIAEWLPFVETQEPGELGWTYWQLSISTTNSNEAEFNLFTQGAPLVPTGDDRYLGAVGSTQRVRVRNYLPGTTPTTLRVAWLLAGNRVDELSQVQVESDLGFNIVAQQVDEAGNPLGEPQITLPPGSGIVNALLPEVTDPVAPPPSEASLTEVTSGAVYFRDAWRGIPSGVDITTMAGPFTSESSLPYPPDATP